MVTVKAKRIYDECEKEWVWIEESAEIPELNTNSYSLDFFVYNLGSMVLPDILSEISGEKKEMLNDGIRLEVCVSPDETVWYAGIRNFVTVKIVQDKEASVWFAESKDVPGLVLESESLDGLLEDLKTEVPELLEQNCMPGIEEVRTEVCLRLQDMLS